ncbi:MAG: hypothetical protein LBG30_06775, partial [Odoribacteraceae bacterium]|nr:hypothetical protein [Odoribacteraceae bacterium]
MIDNLAVALSATTKKWTEDFTYIPMWGYLTGLNIGGTAPTQNPDISLTRAIARIDVSVGEAGNGGDAVRSKFELNRVYLYNYSRAGSLAPATSATGGNVDGYEATQGHADPNPPTETKAFAPHRPSLNDLKVKG